MRNRGRSLYKKQVLVLAVGDPGAEVAYKLLRAIPSTLMASDHFQVTSKGFDSILAEKPGDSAGGGEIPGSDELVGDEAGTDTNLTITVSGGMAGNLVNHEFHIHVFDPKDEQWDSTSDDWLVSWVRDQHAESPFDQVIVLGVVDAGRLRDLNAAGPSAVESWNTVAGIFSSAIDQIGEDIIFDFSLVITGMEDDIVAYCPVEFSVRDYLLAPSNVQKHIVAFLTRETNVEFFNLCKKFLAERASMRWPIGTAPPDFYITLALPHGVHGKQGWLNYDTHAGTPLVSSGPAGQNYRAKGIIPLFADDALLSVVTGKTTPFQAQAEDIAPDPLPRWDTDPPSVNQQTWLERLVGFGT